MILTGGVNILKRLNSLHLALSSCDSSSERIPNLNVVALSILRWKHLSYPRTVWFAYCVVKLLLPSPQAIAILHQQRLG
jgi:hypothetical protein